MNSIVEEMLELEAEGVDFIGISFDKFPKIWYTCTLEEMKNATFYPKTNRKYWKMVDGHKVYIIYK